MLDVVDAEPGDGLDVRGQQLVALVVVVECLCEERLPVIRPGLLRRARRCGGGCWGRSDSA